MDQFFWWYVHKCLYKDICNMWTLLMKRYLLHYSVFMRRRFVNDSESRLFSLQKSEKTIFWLMQCYTMFLISHMIRYHHILLASYNKNIIRFAIQHYMLIWFVFKFVIKCVAVSFNLVTVYIYRTHHSHKHIYARLVTFLK